MKYIKIDDKCFSCKENIEFAIKIECKDKNKKDYVVILILNEKRIYNKDFIQKEWGRMKGLFVK